MKNSSYYNSSEILFLKLLSLGNINLIKRAFFKNKKLLSSNKRGLECAFCMLYIPTKSKDYNIYSFHFRSSNVRPVNKNSHDTFAIHNECSRPEEQTKAFFLYVEWSQNKKLHSLVTFFLKEMERMHRILHEYKIACIVSIWIYYNTLQNFKFITFVWFAMLNKGKNCLPIFTCFRTFFL